LLAIFTLNSVRTAGFSFGLIPIRPFFAFYFGCQEFGFHHFHSVPHRRNPETGTCPADLSRVVRPRPGSPAPESHYGPVKETVTLDLDAPGKTTPEVKVPPRYLFREGQRVLLLEDRDDFRQVLHDYLVSRSFQVISVPSGVEGLREILKDPFDLILCDMMMPLVGGENFYWAVTRMRPAVCHRFIFFTGHQNDPKLKFFFRRVNATVLFKPFKLDALDSAILEVVRKLGY
jgi:CheY-like chemotaxis protein